MSPRGVAERMSGVNTASRRSSKTSGHSVLIVESRAARIALISWSGGCLRVVARGMGPMVLGSTAGGVEARTPPRDPIGYRREAMEWRKWSNWRQFSAGAATESLGRYNRLLITDQTWGLLSRGSQVRILPGVPFLKEIADSGSQKN